MYISKNESILDISQHWPTIWQIVTLLEPHLDTWSKSATTQSNVVLMLDKGSRHWFNIHTILILINLLVFVGVENLLRVGPAQNTIFWPVVDLMLDHRLRRWSDIKSTRGKRRMLSEDCWMTACRDHVHLPSSPGIRHTWLLSINQRTRSTALREVCISMCLCAMPWISQQTQDVESMVV